MSSDEDDLFGENEDEDMEDVKDEEQRQNTVRASSLQGEDFSDRQSPRDSARGDAPDQEAMDDRVPDTSNITTRSRQSSRSPEPAATRHLAPQYSSAAYQRRMDFLPQLPAFDPSNPPTRHTLSLDPTIVIPHPCATYALAATPCLSFLLTGNQDGYIRSWDFWASANSGSSLSALQRGVANLGEGVNKAGVAKGYWRNDVEVDEAIGGDAKNGSIKGKKPQNGTDDGPFSFLESAQVDAPPVERKRVKRLEPVYSLTVQADGLWTLAGTESGPINLSTLRHAPGTIVHALHEPEGHTKAVSALALSSDETSVYSGSWDQTVKQWDLNTGQVVRTFTKHRGQISTIQLRPENVGPGMGNSMAPSLMVGTDESPKDNANNARDENLHTDGDIEMEDAQKKGKENADDSDYDSLFGDEDGEKQDEDVEEKAQIVKGDTANGSGNNKGNTLAAKDEDFPFGGPSTAALSSAKAPPVKPVKPPTVRPNIQGKQGLPALTPAIYRQFSDDVMLVSAIDGEVALHDRRISGNTLVGRLESSEKTPPWCMSACFSSDGQQVIAGRRNASLDVWDVRRMGRSGTKETPSLLRTLKHPATSGHVSCVAAFPDAQHIAVASVDCVRLWNTSDLWQPDSNMKRTKSGVPFRIVAGHHGGTISSIHIDPTGKYMITSSGNRGWFGDTTKVVLVHERK
ncbi:hypothetical protein NliqN6_5705 [Naganishia liquefaciens]|uniref:Transcription factor spt8 beta-propeller domain-containing protein n=1 Tax=Naganishia liquefaciens TaxID=104408 RepID=A0A8H3YHF5_9TREE|nr:hypothetical protein NliqN6_5705 [Naganishia liquefaciens]